eukprot:TRINITY_DN104418_c0_g1_i1.p1 TRINITY_DN104418_c0_g1~~TRINITY_DN104418_c0_g1_i1.p1  ORF type:complete len:241 (+),score=37.32 TRINITY_DN104418_c0_g1_i1:74-724(+)
MSRAVAFMSMLGAAKACFEPECCPSLGEKHIATPELCRSRGCSWFEDDAMCTYTGQSCQDCAAGKVDEPCSTNSSDFCSVCVTRLHRVGVMSWKQECVVDQDKLDERMGAAGACDSVQCCVASGKRAEATPERCNAESNCRYQEGSDFLAAGCYYNGDLCIDCDKTSDLADANKPCRAANATAGHAAFCAEHCRYAWSTPMRGGLTCRSASSAVFV